MASLKSTLVVSHQSGKIAAFALLALLVTVSYSQLFARGQEVVATAKDGGSASDIAYDQGKGEIFVANSSPTAPVSSPM